MRSLTLATFSYLLLGAFAPVSAEVKVASVFGDNMVLQREQPVPVWGMATPGETISVSFGGLEAKAKTGANGKWRVRLAAMEVNDQAQEMTIAGEADKLVLKNVLVGEVWLCAGQSNMGWVVANSNNAAEEIKAAKYPGIRLFESLSASPGKGYPLTPQSRCKGTWQVCAPQSVRRWSAVGYFFGRELHQRLKVPVGILVASHGATAIEAWTSIEGLKAVPIYRERAENYEKLARALLAGKENYERAKAELKAAFPARREAWFKKLDAQAPGLKQKWMSPKLDASAWEGIALPVSVEDNPIGTPVASVWFRKEVSIPEAWVGKELELHFGVIDGVDETFVNGVKAGRTWFDTERYWEASRTYAVPLAATKSARIVIAVRCLKLAYQMAFFGPADEMKLSLKGNPEAQPVSLAGDWRMKKAKDLAPGLEPRLPDERIPGTYYGQPAVMYNGVLHPLIPYAIRGATWYQGEANAPFHADYLHLLPGLINSWRKEWGQGQFPFGIVQLANYQGQQTKPVERWGFLNIRDCQSAALRVPNTFLATAVDIGQGGDIHPRNKQDLGLRLVLGALATAYGQKDLVHSGPTYRSMKIEGNSIRLQFDSAVGLVSKGEPIVGFVIAGKDRKFFFAKARIDGEFIVVRSEKVPAPVAVRYAWANNPVCNLYNGANLPTLLFRTDDWDPAKIVITDDEVVLPTGWQVK